MYRNTKFFFSRKKNKFNNKTCEYSGNIYDSKFEKKVAMNLDLRIKDKEIISYDRQVKISLDVNGYHICNYYIDFVLYYPDGTIEYLEAKGFETDVWKIKWKLFEALYSDKENVKLTVIYNK